MTNTQHNEMSIEPTENDTTMLKITTSDGQEMNISRNIAVMSSTIKNMLEDLDEDDDNAPPIPLPSVDGKTLALIVRFCQHERDEPAKTDSENSEKPPLSEWDIAFFKDMERQQLFEIILAANYLDIPILLDAACGRIADMIKAKTPEEIRQIFGIKNDFTPEEEEQIIKENQWIIGNE